VATSAFGEVQPTPTDRRVDFPSGYKTKATFVSPQLPGLFAEVTAEDKLVYPRPFDDDRSTVDGKVRGIVYRDIALNFSKELDFANGMKEFIIPGRRSSSYLDSYQTPGSSEKNFWVILGENEKTVTSKQYIINLEFNRFKHYQDPKNPSFDFKLNVKNISCVRSKKTLQSKCGSLSSASYEFFEQ
jgi:hypothetical protein